MRSYLNIHDEYQHCGLDYSSTKDSNVFTIAEFIGGGTAETDNQYKFYEISRKDYYIEIIKEQPFF